MAKAINFVQFFLEWAELQGWEVPLLHIRMCDWMETCLARVRVLKVFRGAGKSTLYAVYKAWVLYCDATWRSQIWSADDDLATAMTRDTLNVLRNHPRCEGMLPNKLGVEQFWVNGSTDVRNPSMKANGVLSNATGSRANAVDFDDIEVPKNILQEHARVRLRDRIAESTHILLPDGQKTYIGTPHTHDSIYDEQTAGGASCLEIPLFAHQQRFEKGPTLRLQFDPEDDLCVFHGIGKQARLLKPEEYTVTGRAVKTKQALIGIIDVCCGNAWPARFTRKELEHRRKETTTLNAWDSQYQLQAKPLHESRLDPDRMVPYDVEVDIRLANGQIGMYLGQAQIVSASVYWDPAAGKVNSNDSVVSVLLTDAAGQLYWHRSAELIGEVSAELGEGQCAQVRTLVEELQLSNVYVETNGPGTFLPTILRKHLAGTGCGVIETERVSNKDRYILDAFEAPLSGGFLWVHKSVQETKALRQMRDWIPGAPNQQDDHIDAAAGAIKQTPIRIGRIIGQPKMLKQQSWRPDAGSHEVQFEVGT